MLTEKDFKASSNFIKDIDTKTIISFNHLKLGYK